MHFKVIISDHIGRRTIKCIIVESNMIGLSIYINIYFLFNKIYFKQNRHLEIDLYVVVRPAHESHLF